MDQNMNYEPPAENQSGNCVTVHFQPVGPISKEATEKCPYGFQYNIVLICFPLRADSN